MKGFNSDYFMIKNFKSSGVIGLPDCSLEFGDERIIIIKGPNGSGKSTLLKYITQPIRPIGAGLKANVDEGYIEMCITVNGYDYRILHTMKRKKDNSILNKSHIYKKQANGQWGDTMVDDGGVNKFTDVVSSEFNYKKFYFNTMNIGVDNFGIIAKTDTERMSDIKEILSMGLIQDMLSTASSNRISKKAQVNILNGALINMGDRTVMESRLTQLKQDLHEASSKLLKLNNIQLHPVKQTDIDKLKTDLVSYDSELYNIDTCLNVLNELYPDNSNSIANIIESITTEINLTEANIASIKSNIIELQNELNLTPSGNVDEILNDINMYKDKLNNIDISNYTTTYEEYPALSAVQDYLDTIDNLTQGEDIYELINILNDRDTYMNKYKDLKLEESNISKEITELKYNNENKYTYQLNIVSLTPSDKTPKDCPLYLEWERQCGNERLHNITTKRISELETKLINVQEDIDKLKSLALVSRNITAINSQLPEDMINKYAYVDPLGHYRNVLLSKIADIDMIKRNYVLYTDISNRLNDMTNRLDLITNINAMHNNTLKDKISNMKTQQEEVLMPKLHKLTSDLSAIMNRVKINGKYIAGWDCTKYELSANKSKLVEIIRESEEGLSKLTEMMEVQMNIIDERSQLNETVVKLNSDVNLLKDTIQRYDDTLSQLENVKNDIVLSDTVINILKTELPLAIMRPTLLEIENTVNSLMGDFMSMVFDVDDSKLNITCIRDGITRDISNLSNGEKSILSISLLMALKRYIPWDVISIDEGSATLDESNKDKFIIMLRDFISRTQGINQLFIVSHDVIIEEGMDMAKLEFRDNSIIRTK